jgi:hypothetical protein
MKIYDSKKKPEPFDPSYACNLEKRFPRLVDKITLMWGAKDFPIFLSNLIIDDRGNRQGFPLEVIEEMMFLQEIHDIRLGKRTVVAKEGYRIV